MDQGVRWVCMSCKQEGQDVEAPGTCPYCLEETYFAVSPPDDPRTAEELHDAFITVLMEIADRRNPDAE